MKTKGASAIEERIKKVKEADTDDFVELTQLADLDPRTDYRYANLEGVDFSGADLSGFDFTGARMKECVFRNTKVSSTRFLGVDLDADTILDVSPELHTTVIERAWHRVQGRLRAELGEDVFTSWFGRMELDSSEGNLIRVSVPTKFLSNWLEAHYADRLLACCSAELPGIDRIEFKVRDLLDATSSGRLDQARLTFNPETPRSEEGRAKKEKFFLSYAWGDETQEGRIRDELVDRLCEEATARGITIIRDKSAVHYGERISRFMDRIGRADRVFIILSDKYLRSAYCMHELFEVWRNCRQDQAEFVARTRVYVTSARIGTLWERGQYAIHWRKRFDEVNAFVRQHSLLVLSERDIADYRRMMSFVHETANILALIQDVWRPRDFEDFITYGFDETTKIGR
jgi:internalin A